MIPIGGIIAGALIGARSGRGQPAPVLPGIVVRGIAGFVALVAGLVTSASEDASILVGGAVVFFAGCLTLPELPTRLVLAPLGAARIAFWLDRLSGGALDEDDRGASGELVAAQILAAHPHEASARFVERKLSRHRVLSAAGVAAHALLASSRGRRDEAHALMRVLTRSRHVSRRVHRLAWDYLAADALTRGSAEMLLDKPSAWLGARGRLLQGVVRLVDGADPPGALSLVPVLARTPHPWRTWRRVRDLLRMPRPSAPVFEGALGPYLSLLARAPNDVTSADVVRAAEAIDRLREAPAQLAEIARRALVLRVEKEPGAIADALATSLENELAGWLEAHPRAFGAVITSATLERARVRARSARISRVELLIGDYAARLAARTDLPQKDEWRAWSDLGDALGRARTDALPADLAVIHRAVYSPIVNWAVRAMNVRDLRPLAREQFLVLEVFASAAHDVAAVDLLRRNVSACGANRLARRAPFVGDSSATWEARARRVIGISVLLGLAGVPIAAYLLSRDIAAGLVLLPAAIVTIACALALQSRAVEIALEPDGIAVQNHQGRSYVAPGDVRVNVLFAGLVALRLTRPPVWLSRWLVTRASSAAGARELAARIVARRGERFPDEISVDARAIERSMEISDRPA